MVTRVGSDSEEEDGALIVPTSATATPLPRSLHALDHIALSGDSDGEEGASLILPTVSRTAATTATPTRPPTPTSWMQHNRAALERVAIVIAASLVFFVALQSVRLRSDIATLLKKVEVATTAESAAAAAPTTAPRAPKVTPHTAPHAKRHATYAPAAGMARTVDYIEGRLPRWGPCWNQWDVDGSFTKAVYNETGHAVQYDSGLEVAIPPRPNTKDPWLYEPNHEQTHHETFYPYEQDKLFTWVVDKPTKDGKLVVRGTHVKTVPAHWVVKARIVGPAIVFMPCTRATAPSTSTSFVCTVNAVDPGSYRLEVVLHRKGNYWATNNQDTRTMNPGRSCGVSNAAQYRSMCGDAPHTTHFSPQSLMKHPFAMCGCAAGSAWLTHPDLAAEYVLNRTAAFVVVLGLSSPSPPVERSVRNDTTKRMQQLRAGHHPRTPLCTDGTHAGRWLRLSSMELLGALNGSAYAGSNLDWIQDLVGHNRGWLWAPYDCHYYFYTPREAETCMKQCKIDRISIDNQGDSLNRESLDSNTQILHPGVIVNGQHIKPGTTNEISHRLFWEEVSLGTHPRPAGKGGFAWLGTSAVVRAYIQRSFSHPLDMATFIAKDVVGKRAFMRKQLKGWRRSLYYFPPGLHSHIYSQQRPFLAKLRNALKAAGEWHDVVDASLPTEARWDASHDGLHYLWHEALLSSEHIAWRKKGFDNPKMEELIRDAHADRCESWNGGVSRMNALIGFNLMWNQCCDVAQ